MSEEEKAKLAAEEAKKQELIDANVQAFKGKGLSDDEAKDAAEMLSTIRGVTKATKAQAVVRCRLHEGMEFNVIGTFCSEFTPKPTDANPNPSTIYTVFITCNNGARIKSDYFNGVEDAVTIGVTDEEVCRFVAHHKKQKTLFRLEDYTPRKGDFGTTEGENKYRPESGKVIKVNKTANK